MCDRISVALVIMAEAEVVYGPATREEANVPPPMPAEQVVSLAPVGDNVSADGAKLVKTEALPSVTDGDVKMEDVQSFQFWWRWDVFRVSSIARSSASYLR